MDADKIMVQEKQPNLLLAILCAIGMGLVGCLLWGLLYYIGYIAWVGAYVIVVAAGWGYKKFNLKMDAKGYIIIGIISLVESIVTLFVTLDIAVLIGLADEGIKMSFFECFGAIMDIISADASVRGGVIQDAVLSVVFIGIGLLTFYLIERKRQKDAKAAEAAAQAATELNASGTSSVELVGIGENFVDVVSAIRDFCNVDLAEAKKLAETAPCTIKEGISLDVAEKIAKALRAAGATVEVK